MTCMVKVTVSGNYVTLESPYHPDLPQAAKSLGGKWDAASKCWRFDARDEARVRALAREIYGTDGLAADMVTIRVKVDKIYPAASRKTELYVAGRQIARVLGRDSGAKLGPGVVLVSGEFASGGSRARPELLCAKDTVVEVRDVPRQAALGAIEDSGSYAIQIVDDTKIDRAALESERERLLARLAEINKLLGDNK